MILWVANLCKYLTGDDGHTKLYLFQVDSSKVTWHLVFTGSLDSTVRCWTIERNELQYVCKGHDSIRQWLVLLCKTTSKLVSGSVDRPLVRMLEQRQWWSASSEIERSRLGGILTLWGTFKYPIRGTMVEGVLCGTKMWVYQSMPRKCNDWF